MRRKRDRKAATQKRGGVWGEGGRDKSKIPQGGKRL